MDRGLARQERQRARCRDVAIVRAGDRRGHRRVKSLFDLGAIARCGGRALVARIRSSRHRAPYPGFARGGSIRWLRTRGARRARPAGVGESSEHDGGTLGGGIRSSHRNALSGAQPAHARRRRARPARPSMKLRHSASSGNRAQCLVALAQAVVERRVVLSFRRTSRSRFRA